VIDRMVQQAIAQVMMPYYEEVFSEHSYGFRPNKNCGQALAEGARQIASGRNYVIDLDLEKFFDNVHHDRLMSRLSKRITDRKVLQLIRRFLQAGMMQGGMVCQRITGTPQGSPLSPLLSNIVLDELDKKLESRGLPYVRYADDVKIFAGSIKAAERIKESITGFITARLRLKVNEQKSRICRGYELNFLGHCILSKGNLGLSKESEARLKTKVRIITKRNRGISFEQMTNELNTTLRGWLNYFRKADMTNKLIKMDSWIKHRLRCFRLKQCKRRIGIVRFLQKEGINTKQSWLLALSGKGWWRLSNTPQANRAMSDEWFKKQKHFSLFANYKRYKSNETAVCV
jgi:RNA-directed DNA polymerase